VLRWCCSALVLLVLMVLFWFWQTEKSVIH
jgi:hypothetical protein